ncbi:MAG TPA: DUF2336 domain-containing protein [Methylocella sp.]|nr:DUF2336 domain-containing protein [Methylocella sp.]
MVAQKFLEWAQTASIGERVAAAGVLARAFLDGDLAEPGREEARLVLTALLDDSSFLVRRAIAGHFASAAHVPHYMVLTLAGDHPDIAALVLARSPLLSDAELIDFAATSEAFAQSAIALRPSVSAPVAAALAEVGACEALTALAENPGVELLAFSIRRMIERHGEDARLRAALLARPDLPAALRSDIAGASAQAVASLIAGTTQLAPGKVRLLTREAHERANVQIAAESAGEANGAANFVAHLRGAGQLTAGLLLRALLCGNTHLLAVALSELTGMPVARAAGFVAKSKSAGFAALYRKARMPERVLPAFIAGLQAVAKTHCASPLNARLRQPIVAWVLQACESINRGELDSLIARLRRLEAEAAREEARDFHQAVVEASHAAQSPEHSRRRLPRVTLAAAPERPKRPAKVAELAAA